MSTSTNAGYMEILGCEDVIVDYDYSSSDHILFPLLEPGKKLHPTSLNRKPQFMRCTILLINLEVIEICLYSLPHNTQTSTLEP